VNSMASLPLFDPLGEPQKPRFDGPAYDHARDSARLTAQQQRIFELMKDGKWRTIRHIALEVNAPENSVSAQLRHLRKPRFGSHTVERRHEGGGLYSYRLIVRKP
jgi:hypothetical protein